MKVRILLIAVVLTGVLFSLSVSAQVSCTNPETTEEECTSVPISVTGLSYNREIPKFDTSLGELQSVRITSEACGFTRLDLDSEHPAPTTWFITTRAGIIITLPNGEELLTIFGTPQGEEDEIDTEADNDDEPDFITTDSGFVEYGTPENPVCDSQESVYDTEADMAIFKGSAGETLPVGIFTLSNSIVRNPLSYNYPATSIAGAGGSVCVEYTYCPIPPDVCINGSILDAYTGDPLTGWTVTLQDEAGAIVDTTTTDAGGLYSFCILEPGSYRICEEQRDGWSPVGPTCYDVELIDDDIELPNFENTQRFCISGYMYNGATSEEGLSGWTVQLKQYGAVIDTATTGSDGYYEFCGLLPGSYQVCEVLKPGWTAISDKCISVDLESEDSTENYFRNDIAPPCSSWVLKNELYVAKCGELKVVGADRGLLANERFDEAFVVDPTSITIDPNYGTIEVNEDGSFEYDAADGIRNGAYVVFRYIANNGMCNARYPGIAKIQVYCNC